MSPVCTSSSSRAGRVAERTVRIEGEDLLDVFRSFVAVTYITRRAGGR